MSGFNGSGTFQISSVGLPYVSGTTISSSVANTLNTDLAAGLSNCITKDGQQVLTANIPFNNYKITGLGVGSAATDSASVYNIQCNTGAFITATGTDTIVGTAIPALTSGYVTGMQFQFISAGANTGAVTLNINGQGTKAITKNGTTALVAGDISSGILVTVTYDGTQFVLNNATSLPNLFTGMKNHIINGAMNIAQRGTSFTGVTNASAWPCDRFGYGFLGNCVGTVSQDSSVPSNNQFLYSAKMAVTTATGALAAGNYVVFQQTIEGFNVRDLIGQPFTLSFWIKSSVTGTYCIGFRNAGVGTTADRSYVVEYTINAANTWEYKTITVSGGLITAGNWDWINGIGLVVTWVLAVGSNYITTANAWQTGNYVATTNQVNAAATVGNIVQITGVQLEKGPNATGFEYRPIGLESTLCQRYYQTLPQLTGAYFPATGSNYGGVYRTLQTAMRTTPTVTVAADGVSGRIKISDTPSYSTTLSINAHYSSITVNNVGTAGQSVIAFSAIIDAEF